MIHDDQFNFGEDQTDAELNAAYDRFCDALKRGRGRTAMPSDLRHDFSDYDQQSVDACYQIVPRGDMGNIEAAALNFENGHTFGGALYRRRYMESEGA